MNLITPAITYEAGKVEAFRFTANLALVLAPIALPLNYAFVAYTIASVSSRKNKGDMYNFAEF